MNPTHTLELVPMRNTVRILVNGRDYGQLVRERGGFWSWDVSREGGKLPCLIIREVAHAILNLDRLSNGGCYAHEAICEHIGIDIKTFDFTIP